MLRAVVSDILDERDMKIINLSYEVKEAEIAGFEEYLGFSIPMPFRDFLLKNNVCFVEPNGFFIKNVSEITDKDRPNDSLSCFLGFAESGDESNTLYWALNVHKEQLPAWGLPIAFDHAGNVIFIGLSGEYLGKIYFLSHEVDKHIVCLAEDFASFLGSMSN